MLRLLLCTDWVAGREEILHRISQDVHNKQGNRILMVPELISHDAERRLCMAAGDTASRYAEVLSFSRLVRRVADASGQAVDECLDNGGRVVAMASAARMLHSQLKAYAAVETKPEFLSGLLDAVDEFKRCCISAEDLKQAAASTDGSLAQKLEELALLMEGYDSICARGKRDPRDQMNWCLEQMEASRYARDYVFYIDGFPDFTRQHMAILEHIIQESESVTVCLNCDRPDSSALAFEKAGATAQQLLRIAHSHNIPVQIEKIPGIKNPLSCVTDALFQGSIDPGCAEGVLNVYRGETPFQEVMGAAQYIMEQVRNGCRFRDINLVLSDPGSYLPLVDMVFHRMGILLYRSGTEDILQKTVVATVMHALDAALGGFEQRDVIRYLRSALSPLPEDVCDEVENYAVVWGIRGKKWTENWSNHPDGLSGQWDDDSVSRLEQIEKARADAIVPLHNLRIKLLGARSLKDQVTALYDFLEDLDMANRLAALADAYDAAGDNRSAQILNQLWDILLGALEQVYDVLGETAWDPEHFSKLLRLLLSQYDVGTIPPVLDAVQMGPVSAMRCHQEKHLIILGAEEGKLPGYSGSSGVLTDMDRVTLRQLGVPLTGGAMEGIQAEFAEIYGVFSGAMETICVYCSGEQPSYLYKRLALMAGGEQKILSSVLYAQTNRAEAGTYLAGFHAETEAARMGLAEEFRQAMEKQNHAIGHVSREGIEGIYGKKLNLSASQIEKEAECRLFYFLKYGLRAKERKEVTVDPAEFGTYVHAVLEDTCRSIMDQGGFHQVSLEDTLKIAHEYSQKYTQEHFAQIDSERLTYLFQRNMQELDMVVKDLWEELRQSLFEPKAFEVNFGSGEGLPAIQIPNDSIPAIIRGFIDRMDVWVNGSTSYYRVVDYKTGKKDFDYCDVFNGVGLQMLLYMFALRNSGEANLGKHPIPAGVQYFPARAPYLPADGMLTQEEAEEKRSKEWKRRGLLLHDRDVLQAMEPGDTPKRMDYKVRKKDGALSGDLADRDQMRLLEAYVFRYLGTLVDQIASGNVSPNPYTRGSKHNPCNYCPYGAVCRDKAEEGRRNYMTMESDRFWDEIAEELRNYGR